MCIYITCYFRDADKRKHQMAKLEKKSEDNASEITNSVDQDTTTSSHIIKTKDDFVQPRRRVSRISNGRGGKPGEGTREGEQEEDVRKQSEGIIDRKQRAKSSIVRGNGLSNVTSHVDGEKIDKKRILSAKVDSKQGVDCRIEIGKKCFSDRLSVWRALRERKLQKGVDKKMGVDSNNRGAIRSDGTRTVWTSKNGKQSVTKEDVYDHSIWYSSDRHTLKTKGILRKSKGKCKLKKSMDMECITNNDSRRLLKRETYRGATCKVDAGCGCNTLMGAWGR